MAVYKIFPSYDSTIYSGYSTMNAGLDAILEIKNTLYDGVTPQVARSLIKFDQNEINHVIDNLVGENDYKVYFKAYLAKAEGILNNSILKVLPISGSWVNGNGMFDDYPVNTNGVSWVYRNNYGGESWLYDNYPSYVTGYYTAGNEGGGNWFTDELFDINPTQSFNHRSISDINVDITNIINLWYSSSNDITGSLEINNEGLLLKWEDNIEFNTSSSIQPVLNLFSIDTNTIYPPSIEIKWDDSLYITGSLPIINQSDLYLSISNNPGKFYNESINKFRINTRPEFPIRVYQTSSIQTSNYILPSSSCYAIKDLDTNEYVIDFDENYTKISCDSKGSYFNLNMNGLEPERYFKILIKTTIDGETIIKDDNYYFKIIRG